MVSPQNSPDAINPMASNIAAVGRGLIHPEEAPVLVPRPELVGRSAVGWGAVIAGSFFTTALLILSAVFAYACGIPAYVNGAYGWGAGIWAIVTSALAFLAGGCLSAYLSRPSGPTYSLLHGVAVWCLTLPLLLFLFGGLLFANNFIAADISRMTVLPVPPPNQSGVTGAAWGGLISLAVGLIFAAIGGIVSMGRMSSTTTRTPETERRA